MESVSSHVLEYLQSAVVLFGGHLTPEGKPIPMMGRRAVSNPDPLKLRRQAAVLRNST